jgi:S-DNA-T family DNA segregation ATPase FtsK/SpoIIIE
MLLEDEIRQVCKQISNNEPVKESKKNSLINKFKRDWIKIMALSQLYNKFYNTYSLNKIEFTDYGFSTRIYKVPPLTFDKLDTNRSMIEENLGCSIVLNNYKASKWINAKFIFNQNDEKEFEVIKEKSPYKLYICNDYSGNPIFADLRKYPHILASGTTRSGKSKGEDCTLTNLIVNCSPEELQLYLCQVAKNDLVLYEDVIHTRAFADNLEKTLVVLKYITEIILPDRIAKLKPYRKKAIVDNIYEYNELKKVFTKEPMILIAFDEMMSLFQTKGNSEKEKSIKEEISACIETIAQYGASLSVYLYSSVQRPTVDNLPSFIKAMSNIMISYKQANQKSSEVATDDNKMALNLKQREIVYHLDNWDYGLVPKVNNKKIYEYLKPYIKPHRTLFDDLEKLSHRDGVKKNKEKIDDNLIQVGTHIKTEKEILQENTSKIPNYVPYENPTGKIIIDQTKLSLNTKKIIKNGREKI